MITSFFSHRRSPRGFSLIELLTVIAVIGILAAILLPVTASVRRSVAVSKTRAQLADYAMAYQAFRADYGFYPSMGAPGAEFALSGNNAVFIETLTGRTLDGQPATHAYARAANRRLLRYHSFNIAEFDHPSGSGVGQIVDAFGNPNIHVVVDRSLSGQVSASDFEALPPAMRPASLPGSVFFYTSNPQDNPDWEWVLAWE